MIIACWQKIWYFTRENFQYMKALTKRYVDNFCKCHVNFIPKPKYKFLIGMIYYQLRYCQHSKGSSD